MSAKTYNKNSPSRERLLKTDTVLPGNTSSYYVQELLGEGTYGAVAKCVKVDTEEVVALKMIHKGLIKAGTLEVCALSKLRQLDEDKCNIVKFIEHFQHEGQVCLTFEMLDISLFHFLKRRRLVPLHVTEIRVIAQQMLVALEALKSIGLAHADIKPDNILLVNHQSQPFKVKLIDFGCATDVSKLESNYFIQAVGYRAPEVILGLPLNEGVDMWALGSVLATLFIGRHLYPGESEYEQLRIIVKMQGQPKNHVLKAARKAGAFFTNDSSGQTWRMKTRDEYLQDTGMTVTQCSRLYDAFTSLNDLLRVQKKSMDATEEEDTKAFIGLLKRMLCVDPKRRIIPSEGLCHRFITMNHLSGDTWDKAYVTKACSVVTGCQPEEAAWKPLGTSSEVHSWKETSSKHSSGPAEEQPQTAVTCNINYIVVLPRVTSSDTEGLTGACSLKKTCETAQKNTAVPQQDETDTKDPQKTAASPSTNIHKEKEKEKEITTALLSVTSRKTEGLTGACSLNNTCDTAPKSTAVSQQDKIDTKDPQITAASPSPNIHKDVTPNRAAGKDIESPISCHVHETCQDRLEDPTAVTCEKEMTMVLLSVTSSEAEGWSRASSLKNTCGTAEKNTAVAQQQDKTDTKDQQITAASLSANIRKDRTPNKADVTNIESPAKNNEQESSQNTQGDPSHFIEVKTKKKHFRKVRKFFSRVFKFCACCRGTDDD